MKCRDNCGACCIAPSISSPLPDLPNGKPANMACPHLDDNYRCQLFHHPERHKSVWAITTEFRNVWY